MGKHAGDAEEEILLVPRVDKLNIGYMVSMPLNKHDALYAVVHSRVT